MTDTRALREAIGRLRKDMRPERLAPLLPDPNSAPVALCDPSDLALVLDAVEAILPRPISDAPKDGSTFYTISFQPTRWKAYSPKSQEYKMYGKRGRLQRLNEYGGWESLREPLTYYYGAKPPALPLPEEAGE